MIRYIIVCIANGLLFGFMDAAINANPFARKLMEVYRPIQRTSFNAPAGLVIDLVYGFAIGFVFLLLYNALPGSGGLAKGLVFGLIIWFFRVFMYNATIWMMFNVPMSTVLYNAAAGLLEMLVLGIIYGLFLKPGLFA